MSGRLWKFMDRDTAVPGVIELVEHPEVSTTAAADGTWSLDVTGLEGSITPRFAGGDVGDEVYVASSQRTFEAAQDAECVYTQAVTEPVFGLLTTLLEDAGETVDPNACHVVTTIQDETVTQACAWDDYKAHDPHGVAGILADLDGAPGEPIYFGEDVFPDPELTASTIDGGVLWLNLEVGRSYTITAQDPAGNLTFEPLTVTCHTAGLVNATPPWGLRPM